MMSMSSSGFNSPLHHLRRQLPQSVECLKSKVVEVAFLWSGAEISQNILWSWANWAVSYHLKKIRVLIIKHFVDCQRKCTQGQKLTIAYTHTHTQKRDWFWSGSGKLLVSTFHTIDHKWSMQSCSGLNFVFQSAADDWHDVKCVLKRQGEWIIWREK